MSEAEQAIEDLFNEEILGRQPAPENEAPFPEAPPEPKPVEEIADPDEVPPETPEEVSDTPEPDGETVEEAPSETADEVSDIPDEEPHLAWARRKYGDDFDLSTESSRILAKSNYEQEKMLGRKAEEDKRREEEEERTAILSQIDALHTYGMLTPEEDAWIDAQIAEGDIQEAAQAVIQNGRLDLFTPLVERFSAQSDEHARFGNWVRSQVLQAITATHIGPQPSPAEQRRLEYQQVFASVGLDLDAHGPIVRDKAAEVGGYYSHALEKGDEGQKAMAARALYDLASASQTEVSKHRLDDVVEQRVREEELRRGAAGVTQGGARVEPPKKEPFWESYNEEIAEKGWDGNRPSYRDDS